ncbi:ACT domain-containing protein [Litoribaculum gwangyangense]|uniref:ACT domain-containing protein n=1 Tax=Litoribaculum gwangyangense TaxID=1130722 RepID=A0ABP9CPU3_9FLAO
MTGEKNLAKLIREMNPKLHGGNYVFVSVTDVSFINRADILCEFKEPEGITLVMEQKKADEFKFDYDFVASWITLMVHSSLDAVGLTALFSSALAKHNISCNVIAGYYHDHLFVNAKDAEKAMSVLLRLSKK